MIEVSIVEGWASTGELNPTTLTYSDPLNAAGAWTMQLPYDRDLEAAFAESGSGIRVVDNGVAWVGVCKRCEPINFETLNVSGVSALATLADRLPIPEPDDAVGPWSTDEFHTVTAAPVAAWVSLLGAHVGQANVRRLPQTCTVVGTGTVAGSVTLSARWSPDLLALVEDLATGTGVQVSADLVKGDADRELVFTVSALPTAASVIFDPDLGSVSGVRVVRQPEWPTHVYVGGSGEGTARVVRLRSIDGPRRIERWLEASSSDTDELDTLGDAFLVANKATTTLEVEIDDSQLAYGVDYRVGDLATVRVAGVGRSVERVTAVEVSVDARGVRRKVKVGNGSISLLGDRSTARVGRLEGA